MPKSTKNTKGKRLTKRVSLPTLNTPPNSLGRLVDVGLVLADGTIVGVAQHPDAHLFRAVVEWRAALMEMQNATGTDREIAALSRYANADKKLITRQPKTGEGVSVLLELACTQVEMLPTRFGLVVAAVRAAVAIGV